ncbi:hypothetical protein FXO38_35418 [Capsicum annuum]|nr:hypothetical protein FXO38_35418 [Capsicum annuum]KAF3633110.1 hypothetical protein FXO37_27194 [Capsicum annuum]
MANMAAGQPLSMADQPSFDNFTSLSTKGMESETLQPTLLVLNYTNILKSKSVILGNNSSTHKVDPIPIKKQHFINGSPRVRWIEEEVNRMNIIKGLQYVVIGKFSYGWPDLEDLKLQLPGQLNVKGIATVNKTRSNCARIKVQVDIMVDLPNYVEMEIVNSITNDARVEKVKIQYDFLLKYCKRCILQGNNEQECRILHPESNQGYGDDEKQDISVHHTDKNKVEKSNKHKGWDKVKEGMLKKEGGTLQEGGFPSRDTRMRTIKMLIIIL